MPLITCDIATKKISFDWKQSIISLKISKFKLIKIWIGLSFVILMNQKRSGTSIVDDSKKCREKWLSYNLITYKNKKASNHHWLTPLPIFLSHTLNLQKLYLNSYRKPQPQTSSSRIVTDTYIWVRYSWYSLIILLLLVLSISLAYINVELSRWYSLFLSYNWIQFVVIFQEEEEIVRDNMNLKLEK